MTVEKIEPGSRIQSALDLGGKIISVDKPINTPKIPTPKSTPQ